MEASMHSSKRPAVLIAILFFASIVPAQEIRYGTGAWEAESLGDHRAVVRVDAKADAVRVVIPWRRSDAQPEKKDILIVDAATGAVLKNVARLTVDREFGDFVFQPVTAPGDYFVYYLPYKTKGRSNYPTVFYPEPTATAEPEWLSRNGLNAETYLRRGLRSFPAARTVALESVDAFNSFYPMETIATREETERLVARNPGAAVLLFPEDRRFPIRMTKDLPARWIESGPRDSFASEALRGEFYVFQVGVYAVRRDIPDLSVVFDDLKSGDGSAVIPASAFRCINVGGVNWDGQRFTKPCPVAKGTVRALWCGVQVPAGARPGDYRGLVTVGPRDGAGSSIRLSLRVKPEVIPDAGDSELWRQSRLRWLDSTIALDDDVIAPFTAVTVKDRTLGVLGRTLTLGTMGLPESLKSFFSAGVTGFVDQGLELLAAPMGLVIDRADGVPLAWQDLDVKVTDIKPGVIRWRAESRAEGWSALTEALLECDGFAQFQVTLTATADRRVKDISLRIPLRREAAKYMMGLGFKGGLRPERFHWMWDPRNNQDALWVGAVNAGLQVSLRGENYARPLNTNFYLSKPLLMPPAWHNQGRGGVLVEDRPGGIVLLKAYGGPRAVRQGEALHFNFNLLLTPFKPLDAKGQFKTRFFHSFKPAAEVAATGANTINVHHANAINPYINYPFLRPEAMKKYIDEAHARGLKVKIYYTIRELSNRAAEIFGLRSLGDEIFSKGPGGGFAWLQEHLVSNYIAAWFVPELKDAAIINSGMSRWHNYYLEGLDWLCRHVGIDGLYIDDVAFDRTTMKRVRKILDRDRPGALIDLHSANQYNPRDGYASSANLYLEHFPYLNRLWFGEYFDYNASPDYWLVEISGIPFGLMGEMLEGGGNPWRGMVYGMTNRLPWSGNDPARLWKVWDEFGIVDSKMTGYWANSCPVKTDNDSVPATAYVKSGKTLVALASWAKKPAAVRLVLDWESLGLRAERAVIYAPAIPDFQDAAVFHPGATIPVAPGKGWLLIISEGTDRR
jgi:hypothetical protein